jgi:hypothetical protein
VEPQREHGEGDNVIADTGVGFEESQDHEEGKYDERMRVGELEGKWEGVE